MKILVPETYNIVSSSGTALSGSALLDALSSEQTYKFTNVNGSGTITTNITKQVAALVSGITPTGISTQNPTKRFAAWSDTLGSFSWTGSGSITSLVVGDVYDFPSLPASAWQPRTFNTKYSNNLSGMGEFIGRNVVRSGLSVSLSPMSFSIDEEDLNGLDALFEGMRKGAVVVYMESPHNPYIYYGWTTAEPELKYNGDVDQMTISFSLQCVV